MAESSFFQLTPFSLSQISCYPLPYDFSLILDGKEYKIHLFKLQCVSSFKPQNNSTQFVFSNLKDPHNYFKKFLDILDGQEIDLNIENAPFFYEIASQLEIKTLADQALRIITFDFTPENYELIPKLAKSFYEHNLNFAKYSNFMAKNWDSFYQMHSTMKLPLPVLDAIIQSEDFNVPSETQLFEWIEEVIKRNDRSYCKLFGHVEFSKLRSGHIRHLLSAISYDEVDQFLWEELHERLTTEIILDDYSSDFEEEAEEESYNYDQEDEQINNNLMTNMQQSQWSQINVLPIDPQILALQNQQQIQQAKKDDVMMLDYQDGYELSGVITYLQANYKDQTYLQYVNLTGGGTKLEKIYNLFDYDDTRGTWWDNYDGNLQKCTPDNAWCMIELVGYTLQLQAYTIASSAPHPNKHQPRSWRIDVSSNGIDFHTVDTVRNCSRMNTSTPICTFTIPQVTEPIRFIKFILTENFMPKNSSNQLELSLSAFEIFGKLQKM